MVHSREIDGQTYTFGISGRLYKSNVLLYDHQTESLWSQLMEKAISGPMAGKTISRISSSRTTWKSWVRQHPETRILSMRTGFRRNYSIDPYEKYFRAGGLWFPVGKVRSDFPPKEMVLGIEIGGHSKAYPLSQLRLAAGTLVDRVGQYQVKIDLDAGGQVMRVTDGRGEPVEHLFAFWFAWQAFQPDSEVWIGHR